MAGGLPAIANGGMLPLAGVPVLSPGEFRDAVLGAVGDGGRLSAYFGMPCAGAAARLVAVLARPERGDLALASMEAEGAFRSLTPDCPQAHLFEREIAEQLGLRPEGHPWPKPVRAPMPPEAFFRVEGEGVHEVAVGPVHAGVIEPGHFRFQCLGEEVLHLEIALGYQHRGVERALVGGPSKRSPHHLETAAGDTTVGHATAYAEALEALSGCRVPARALALRAVALELERMANHAGDLGALAADAGYLPTASFCGRLRGDFLNLTALLCGSRFGRGLVRPGGVGFDMDAPRCGQLLERLDVAMQGLAGAVALLWDSASAMARFEGTGTVSPETARSLGLVGPPARASGIERDARMEFPSGLWRVAQVPVSTWPTGDVFARAWVRWLEVQRSAAFVREQAGSLPGSATAAAAGRLAPGSLSVSLVEGWRGEICHVAVTDAAGRFARYKVVDPSFHNWTGLAMALRGQAVSDFPLCNKSFNLSYCGFDL